MEKVSVSKVEKMMKENYNNIVSVELNGLPLKIKKTISLNDMTSMVAYIYSNAFNDDGEYVPEVFDFALRCITIELYSNVTLPKNIESKYTFAYESCIYEAIMEVVNEEQYAAICEAAHRKISNRLKTNSDELRKQLSVIADEFKTIAAGLSSFKNISPDDLKAVMEAVGEHGIDEAKLMNAYMAYKSGEA